MLSSERDFFVEVVVDLFRIDRRDRSRLRRGCCGTVAVLGRRDAHPQGRLHRAAELCHRREHGDNLAGPAMTGIAERAADRAIVDPVEDKAVVVIGEPDDELALLVLTNTDFFLGYRLDAELLLSRQITGLEKSRLIVCRS